MTQDELKSDEGKREEIWSCQIGGFITNPIRPGGDWPMRKAIQKAFHDLTGEHAEFCFSGWGSDLDEGYREVVEMDRKRNVQKSNGF